MPPALVDPHVLREPSGSVTAGNLSASLELDFRVSALRVGWWLGWAALVSVVVGIAVGADAGHRWLLLALAAAASAGNLATMLVPWREWLRPGRRGPPARLSVGALLGFVRLPRRGRGPSPSSP